MRLYVGIAMVLLLGIGVGTPQVVYAGTPSGNGDVNASGTIDIADAIYLLTYLFAKGPVPEPIVCPPPPPGTTLTLPGNVPLEMVSCPAGTFMMGRYAGEQDSNGWEDVQHQVTLARGFCLGKYEVTKRQWQAVMGTTPWMGHANVLDDPDSPAVYVTWDDAQAFIAAVNALGQGAFSLPTEAQWEYACRAGTTTRFYWGDDPDYTQIGSYAWYKANTWDVGEYYAHVVGQKLPNAWGLYDMSGNVWEWCQDWWEDPYSSGAVTDPSGPPGGFLRVYRGGAWGFYPRTCRSALRYGIEPWGGYDALGFRLARTSPL